MSQTGKKQPGSSPGADNANARSAGKPHAARASEKRPPTPVDSDQSVAGEEDPGSALDTMETNQRPSENRSAE